MDNFRFSEDFGSRLRAARNSADLTLAYVAAHLGKGVSTLSDWEKGKAQPSLADIHAMAKLLGCNPGILAFGISGNSPQPQAIVEEAQASYGVTNRESLHAKLDRAIDAAADNADRLGWISVQLDTHLRPPANWVDDAAAVAEAKRLMAAVRKPTGPATPEQTQRSG